MRAEWISRFEVHSSVVTQGEAIAFCLKKAKSTKDKVRLLGNNVRESWTIWPDDTIEWVSGLKWIIYDHAGRIKERSSR